MTRQDAKALTRGRLLAEAQRLFRERGYGATSLEQVAEAAQVTKGAIYGHFSSKEDLLLSAARRTCCCRRPRPRRCPPGRPR